MIPFASEPLCLNSNPFVMLIDSDRTFTVRNARIPKSSGAKRSDDCPSAFTHYRASECFTIVVHLSVCHAFPHDQRSIVSRDTSENPPSVYLRASSRIVQSDGCCRADLSLLNDLVNNLNAFKLIQFSHQHSNIRRWHVLLNALGRVEQRVLGQDAN